MRNHFFLLAAILVFLSSCSDQSVIWVDTSEIPEPFKETWNAYLLENPPPENIRLSPSNGYSAAASISVSENEYTEGELFRNSDPLTVTDKKVLRSEFYAPAIPLTDPENSVSLKEVKEKVFPVLPLANIHLPLKGAAVDGLYPGDSAYPLVKTTFLTLSLQTDEPETRDSIANWFSRFPEVKDKNGILWIGSVGDIMVGRGVQDLLLQGDSGIKTVFGDTLPVLKKHDLVLGNLEGAVSLRGAKIAKSYNFRFSPEVLSPLKKAGFVYLSVTNNHCFDYGENGFLDTIKNMAESKIPTSGAGTNKEDALKPWNTSLKQQEISVFSIGAYPTEKNGFNGSVIAAAGESKPGILWADPATLQKISETIKPGKFTIIFVHGGIEWTNFPSEEQIKLYRSFIDNGADLVLGSHPHVLQGVEAYKKGLIAYSLGNFIFPGMDETRFGEESLILSAGIYNGEIKYIRFYPVQIDNRRVYLDKSGRILKRFITLTEALINAREAQ